MARELIDPPQLRATYGNYRAGHRETLSAVAAGNQLFPASFDGRKSARECDGRWRKSAPNGVPVEIGMHPPILLSQRLRNSVRSGCWQLGHFTALPASSSPALSFFPHPGHWTVMVAGAAATVEPFRRQ